MAVFSSFMAQEIAKGNVVISPLMCHYLLSFAPALGTDWATWKNYSLELLTKCDELWVLMLPGWELSEGVKQEIKSAEDLGIPVRYISMAMDSLIYKLQE